jgi:ADP-heptose:LPS heptosyltransferase
VIKKQILLWGFLITAPQLRAEPSAQEYREQADQLRSQGLYMQAIEEYQKTFALEPNSITTNFDLAYTYNMIGQTHSALNAYHEILRFMPDEVSILYNMGYTHKMAGNCNEAIALYLKVLELQPDHAQSRFALALAYLNKGDFIEGWQRYNWYLTKENRDCPLLRAYVHDNSLAGKTILLRPEGGLGDTLQFIRYAKVIHDAGAQVLTFAQKPLHHLLKLCPYIDGVLDFVDQWPGHNALANMMSLPAIFNSQEKEMATMVPYLYADEQLVADWKNYFAHDHNLKIGLCWHADSHNDSSRLPVARRSIPLALLAQLAQKNNFSFYSLQQCEGLEQLQIRSPEFVIHTFEGDFDQSHGRFMDTAAVMKNLDLVITVDTAVAHLAGGLGIPVFLMLPYSTDWRWIVGRTDTPWYPTMRIFKQPAPFDWQSVVDAIDQALTVFVQENEREGNKPHA